MIRINLIPYRDARRRRQIMEHVGYFVAVLALTVALVMGAHTISSMQLSELQEKTAELTAQNKVLKEKIGKIEHLDALRADVERKLEIVDRLQEGRFHSLTTLHEIAQLIPRNVWLTSITDSTTEIALIGMAESNKAVANFMRQLDQSPIFSNVKLLAINRIDLGGMPVRQFSINLSRIEKGAEKEANSDVAGKQGAS